MDIRKISWFLALTLVISLGLYQLSIWFIPAGMAQIAATIGYLWGPALAAWIVQRLICQTSTARYGWTRKHFSFSWIGLSVIAPALVVGLVLGITYCMGNILHLPGFGEIYREAGMTGSSSAWPASYPEASQILRTLGMALPPEVWMLVGIIAIASILWGATLGLLVNFGPEAGFRGLMLRETQSLGFLGSNMVIGLIWGAWIVLLQVIQGDTDTWSLLTTMGFYLSAAFPMAWIAFKARSVHASATFIGILENLLIIPGVFISSDHPLVTTPHSLAAMWALLLITFLILKFDPDFEQKYQDRVY